MRNLLGRTSVALGAVALAVGLTAASSVAASAATHARHVVKPDAISSLCHYTSAEPELFEGSSGVAVEQAQCEINWAYAYGSPINFGNGPYGGLTVDGSFGPLTESATKDFQGCAGIGTDGIIGPITWSHLDFWVNQPGFC